MSVESAVITLIAEEGISALKKVYSQGLSAEDFISYDEEFAWFEQRAEKRKPINPTSFRNTFADFEWLPPKERIQDLLIDLKDERAYSEMRALAQTIDENLVGDNAVELAEQAKEMVSQIIRAHAPQSSSNLFSDVDEHLKRVKQKMLLAKQSVAFGLPSGFPHIDFHCDGFVKGRYTVVLGRPGAGKSGMFTKIAWAAAKEGYRVGFFSPEMNQDEHYARFHTIASADPDVQAAVGLKHSFRNRALLRGSGFNYKSYVRLCQYLKEFEGDIPLLTQQNRKQKMTPAYIESRIDDLGLDMVIIDPIYLLHLPGAQKLEQTAKIGQLSTEVQYLAKQFDIPVIASNQANRTGGLKDDAPHMDRSYNSDVPAHEADHVFGVRYFSDEKTFKLRCSKNRHGETFSFDSHYYPNTGVYKEITPLPKKTYYTNGQADMTEEDFDAIMESAK